MKKVLIDMAGTIKLSLSESSGGKLVARGEFGRADVPTQNGRTYPRPLWEREVSRIQAAIREGKVMGQLEHPSDGKTALSRVSHIITGLEIHDDGRIIGEARILDNEHGRQLRSILEGGGAVGISSRGMGSTAMESTGEVVQDDYQYMTHDFVADPAVITSYPKFVSEVRWIESGEVISENQEKEMAEVKGLRLNPAEQKLVRFLQSNAKMLKELEASKNPLQTMGELDVAEKARVDANAAYEMGNVLNALGIKVESVQSESLLVTPEVIGKKEEEPSKESEKAKDGEEDKESDGDDESDKGNSKKDEEPAKEIETPETKHDLKILMDTLKDVLAPLLPKSESKEITDFKAVIEAKDAEIKSLSEKIVELGKICDGFAAKIHLGECMAKLGEQAKEVQIMIEGKSLDTVEKVDEALLEAKKIIAHRKIRQESRAAEVAKVEARYESVVKSLEKQNLELKGALEEAVKTTKELGVRVYVEGRIRGNSNAAKIRELCEGKTDRKEIDEIILRYGEKPVVSEDFSAIRRRLSRVANTTLVEDQLRASGDGKKAGLSQVEQEMAELIPGGLESSKSLM